MSHAVRFSQSQADCGGMHAADFHTGSGDLASWEGDERGKDESKRQGLVGRFGESQVKKQRKEDFEMEL